MHPHAGSMSATVPLRSLLVLLLATFSVASLLDECLEITDCLACNSLRSLMFGFASPSMAGSINSCATGIQHEGCGYCGMPNRKGFPFYPL